MKADLVAWSVVSLVPANHHVYHKPQEVQRIANVVAFATPGMLSFFLLSSFRQFLS